MNNNTIIHTDKIRIRKKKGIRRRFKHFIIRIYKLFNYEYTEYEIRYPINFCHLLGVKFSLHTKIILIGQ